MKTRMRLLFATPALALLTTSVLAQGDTSTEALKRQIDALQIRVAALEVKQTTLGAHDAVSHATWRTGRATASESDDSTIRQRLWGEGSRR